MSYGITLLCVYTNCFFIFYNSCYQTRVFLFDKLELTTVLNEGTAVLNEDTAVLNEDTAVLNEDTAVLNEGTAVDKL